MSAYLFGSVAEGRAHRESHADVGVLLDWSVYPSARDRFERRHTLIAALQRASGRFAHLIPFHRSLACG